MRQLHMRRALKLARLGAGTCMPNPQVGCVIERDGRIIGEGWHRRAGEEHAEVLALRQAGAAARGASMYVNLEPCAHAGRTPPCVDQVIAAKLARVVVAMLDPDPRVNGSGLARLRAAGIDCAVGMLAQQARWLNRGFVSRVTRRRPWLCLKTAASMDGKIALSDGTSKWITSAQARREVHLLRAQSCAVLTGSNTALADDPQLTAREVNAQRQPLRVLVDGSARCPASLAMFQNGAALVATAKNARRKYPSNVMQLRLAGKGGRVDLPKLLSRLAGDYQVNFVLVECGAALAGALLEADLVDEVMAFVAPAYLGSGLPVAQLGASASLEAAPRFKVRALRKVGSDALIQLQRRD